MSMREFGRADALLDTTSSQVETAAWPARRRKQRNCWQGESGLDDPERLTLTLLHKPLPIHNLQGPRKIKHFQGRFERTLHPPNTP
jgi:hypothetical protein